MPQTLPIASDEIHCPMCEYDLRGLIEPRCPECGYRFDWEELRDAGRRLHPYLFEHHPERNVGSFVQTALGGWRPVKFWRTLLPMQPSNPRRLVLYYAIVVALLTLPQIPMAVLWIYISRAPFLSLQRFYEYSDAWGPLLSLFALSIFWPWLTLAAMLIFQQSMRSRRIRSVHMLRCVVYSSDLLIYPAIAAAVAATLSIYELVSAGGAGPPTDSVKVLTVTTLLATFPLFAYRLWTSIRYYLRFDHAIATTLAVQLVAFLTLAVLLARIFGP